MPAEPELIDALATVGAEREDLEDGGDYERTDPAAEATGGFDYWQGKPTDASDHKPDHDGEREEGVF